MTTQLYTEIDLRKLKGQALKDVWHKMIGKPPGLHNTTGLHNSEEILQAILQGQKDPEYLNRFTKQHKQKEVEPVVEMPPQERKKPGPKPKPKPDQNPIVIPPPSTALRILAVESMEEPQKKMEVERIKLTRLHIGSESYFLDRASNTVYAMENNKPGSIYGSWDPVARSVQADS